MCGKPSGWLTLTVVIAAVACGTCARAQTAGLDRNAIVIDPAHGGTDAGGRMGSKLGEQIQEKDVTLAFASKLRPLLEARGFNVVMTRVGDQDGGTLDQRAEIANRTHAVACLVVHASARTHGIVLGTSALGTALTRSLEEMFPKPGAGVPWGRAQEAYVVQSERLANQVGTALSRAGFATTMMRVVMRPLDHLTCAAMSIELGGNPGEGVAADASTAWDDSSQQHVAETLADALALWRNQAQPPEYVPVLEGSTGLMSVAPSGRGERPDFGATP